MYANKKQDTWDYARKNMKMSQELVYTKCAKFKKRKKNNNTIIIFKPKKRFQEKHTLRVSHAVACASGVYKRTVHYLNDGIMG